MEQEKESPAARQRRLAAALRENLQKRKAQQRSRGEGAGAAAQGGEGVPAPRGRKSPDSA
mgnify:CR=1 FL=1